MPKIIIADTSCFIILANIDELELLSGLYGQILTTPDVALEYGDVLPRWVQITDVANKYTQQLLQLQIDKGEASAIALALETPDSLVVLDDNKARKTAQTLGLNYTGTIGIIIKAKKEGFIASIKPLLEKIKQTNFRLSDKIEQEALKEAGE